MISNLVQRVYQHKVREYKNSFYYRYNLKCLVCFEWFESIEEAIALTSGNRERKLDLINEFNPSWTDLYDSLNFD